MRNKILLLIVVILLVILVVVDNKSSTTFFDTIALIRVKDPLNNIVKELNIEDYIIGVVASEMPASFESEALKAQAVAARTYALYKIKNNSNMEYDIKAGISDQGYISIDEMHKKWGSSFNKYYEKIKKAVMDTKNEVMYYKDDIIKSYYFSMSNGYTEEVSLVFKEERDYLKSVESHYEEDNKNYLAKKVYTQKEVCNLLKLDCNQISISNIERSKTNRVNYITINNIKMKGTDIRKKLSLRSTDFDIFIDGDKVNITTKGYGHGVGMSQYGANGMAKEGYTYDQILKHYYQNITIKTI